MPFIVFLALTFISSFIFAAPKILTPKNCIARLGEICPETPTAGRTGRQADAIDLLVEHEVNDNVKEMREFVSPVNIDTVMVPKSKVIIEHSDDIPKELLDFFVQGDKVLWPMHPRNHVEGIPYSRHKPDGEMTVQFTSSRSMIFRLKDGRVYSVKLPTNEIHPNVVFTGKADVSDDAKAAIPTTRQTDRFDEHLKPDPDILVLRDVLSIRDRKTGNGFVVRDLTPLNKTGKLYLPAFSLPFIGGAYAQKFGEPFETFWGKHYAQALGRAKAKFLLRYGLQMVTPNAQNLLIEVNPNGMPTGRIVFRDIVDSHAIRSISDAILSKKEMDLGDIDPYLKPYGENSFWKMDEDGKDRVSTVMASNWERLHDAEYLKTLGEALGNKFSSLADAREFLASFPGHKALREYQRKNSTK